ncbi:MAG: hypothetical protein WED00_08115 [Aquisalimonadaceae bacterium]
MKRIMRILVGTAGVWFLLALFASSEVFAVAGYARQTGMSCNQCHTAHGGATPNFTFTGKKFNAMGYRLQGSPHTTQTVQEQGEVGDRGEYMNMLPLTFSGRFQHQWLANTKPPGGPNEGEWGDPLTNPTSRLAFFPFIGPIGNNFGVWTEFYIVPLHSAEWGAADASFEEMDFRYILNPDSKRNIYGFALTNQGIGDIFGFGPWPAVGLASSVGGRAGIGGYSHPNFATVAMYGWMNDRWAWALGANTGDTNYYWDNANATGFLGYALANGNDREIWINAYARTGNDGLPLVTSPGIDDNEYVYSDGVPGVSGTRTSACPTPEREMRADPANCTYLAEEMDSHLTADLEFRWSGQSVAQMFTSNPQVGNWSYEVVARLGYNTEEYKDGAETELTTWGVATQFGWKHTYYIKPYVNGNMTYEFTDENGNSYDIDTVPSYGIWLSYKPVENFLIHFEYHNLQSNSLNNDAGDDGARYAISTDVSF